MTQFLIYWQDLFKKCFLSLISLICFLLLADMCFHTPSSVKWKRKLMLYPFTWPSFSCSVFTNRPLFVPRPHIALCSLASACLEKLTRTSNIEDLLEEGPSHPVPSHFLNNMWILWSHVCFDFYICRAPPPPWCCHRWISRPYHSITKPSTTHCSHKHILHSWAFLSNLLQILVQLFRQQEINVMFETSEASKCKVNDEADILR